MVQSGLDSLNEVWLCSVFLVFFGYSSLTLTMNHWTLVLVVLLVRPCPWLWKPSPQPGSRRSGRTACSTCVGAAQLHVWVVLSVKEQFGGSTLVCLSGSTTFDLLSVCSSISSSDSSLVFQVCVWCPDSSLVWVFFGSLGFKFLKFLSAGSYRFFLQRTHLS